MAKYRLYFKRSKTKVLTKLSSCYDKRIQCFFFFNSKGLKVIKRFLFFYILPFWNRLFGGYQISVNNSVERTHVCNNAKRRGDSSTIRFYFCLILCKYQNNTDLFAGQSRKIKNVLNNYRVCVTDAWL